MTRRRSSKLLDEAYKRGWTLLREKNNIILQRGGKILVVGSSVKNQRAILNVRSAMRRMDRPENKP